MESGEGETRGKVWRGGDEMESKARIRLSGAVNRQSLCLSQSSYLSLTERFETSPENTENVLRA